MQPPTADPPTSLVVFARAPVAGRVKTRLCQGSAGGGPRPVGPAAAGPRALSPDEAAALHLAFLADVCRAGAESGLPRRRLYVAGAGGEAALAELAARTGFALRAQGAGDLGRRMDEAIAAEFGAGAAAVVLVGCDSPTLPPAWLREAGALLREADLVLGPATDGGYWLVGARRRCPELFAGGVPWGTGGVLLETLRRLAHLQAAGWRVRLLPFLYDVDTPADLALLVAELRLRPEAAPTSRAALARLGLL